MGNYQFGKDIAEIQQQITMLRVEVAQLKKGAEKDSCTECIDIVEDYEEVSKDKKGLVDSKTFTLSRRIHDEECWCSRATVTVYSNGRYEFRSTQRNSSQWPDPQGGDHHEMFIELLDKNRRPTSQQLITNFSAKRFVANGRKKPLSAEGLDTKIKDDFKRINRVTFSINCS